MNKNKKMYLFLEKLWLAFTIAMIPVGVSAYILNDWTLVAIESCLAGGALASFITMGFFDPYGGCP